MKYYSIIRISESYSLLDGVSIILTTKSFDHAVSHLNYYLDVLVATMSREWEVNYRNFDLVDGALKAIIFNAQKFNCSTINTTYFLIVENNIEE